MKKKLFFNDLIYLNNSITLFFINLLEKIILGMLKILKNNCVIVFVIIITFFLDANKNGDNRINIPFFLCLHFNTLYNKIKKANDIKQYSLYIYSN